MYAVIETGGKQYRVSEGDAISVEKLPYEVGEKVEFERVLLVSDKKGVTIGQPIVTGAKVVARVESEERRRDNLDETHEHVSGNTWKSAESRGGSTCLYGLGFSTA